MIEIKNIGGFDKVDTWGGPIHLPVYKLFIDGTLVDGAQVSGGGQATSDGTWFTIHIKDYETFERLAAYSFKDFPGSVSEFILSLKVDWAAYCRYIHLSESHDSPFFYITFCFELPLADWKKLYSPMEYYLEFKAVSSAYDKIDVLLSDPEDGLVRGFVARFAPVLKSVQIAEEFSMCSAILRKIQYEVTRSLASRHDNNSIVMQFDFPEAVRVPCEQYLLYFAQFLRDLGVQADTALTHEAGQVLFTVTPVDKDQALDKISAALNVYLHLPSNPVSDAANESIDVQRLEANVLRLRSDLKLAAAELQAKNTTIEAQRLMLDVQKGLLSGEIVVNAMKDVTPKPKDANKEELFGGTISLIPIKGKGLEINLPELFRQFKRLFKKEE